MCLAVPAKVISIEDDLFSAEVDVMGNKKKISIVLLPEAVIGDWVLIHAGEAISVITEEEAQASLEVWEEILDDEGEQ